MLVGALGGVLAGLMGAGFSGLGDSDPYRHLEYARQLVRTGFTLAGHPFLPLTILGDTGVDLWWGFHVLLTPFTLLSNEDGGRVAGVVFAALTATSMALLLRKAAGDCAVWFALIPLVASPTFAFRDHLARPSHLTIPLLLVNLLCGARVIPIGWAPVASAVHALMHLSAPLSPAFAALGAIARWLTRTPLSTPGQGGMARPVLWSLGGFAVGLLLHPGGGAYVAAALRVSTGALGLSELGRLPHTAPELAPSSLSLLLRETGLPYALLGLSVLLGWRRERLAEPATRWAASLGALLTLAMCFASMRFLDYQVPLVALTAAAFWPKAQETPPRISSRARKLMLAAGAALFLAFALGLVADNVRRGWRIGQRFFDEPQTFQAMASAVRAHVPAGAMIFTDDPFLTGILYSYLPEYRYIVAYDPAVLYSVRPGLFWRWHHAVVHGALCDEPDCGTLAPDPGALAAAIQSFTSHFVITSYPPRVFSMQTVMHATPALFQRVTSVPGRATGLHLWRLLHGEEAASQAGAR